MDAFDYFAFVVLAVLLATGVTIIVLLGSLPGAVAKSRNHPNASAINVASWISLVTLGALWPLALVWAYSGPTGGVPASEGRPAQ
ncbi:Inner membrane protein YiaW [Pirellulimonas nuda]|uniref:Inner membrane protein YiaW n=1 Tax=Pirellulimonas nuda TaxID=2528009 RepID=A0A518D965_9BACT|nr:DUF3302 domain-containing protein [Pirellulimonas nuda]QDU88005.1 Inner membrane protein YiaW [Pirellulimonas nuda]